MAVAKFNFNASISHLLYGRCKGKDVEGLA